MKPLRIILLLAAAQFTISCNSKLSEMKKTLEKKLGVPIVMQAQDSDQCATQQVQKLVKEFKKMKSKQRDELKQKLAKHSSIEIKSSLQTQIITGSKIKLALGKIVSGTQSYCYPSPWNSAGSRATFCSSIPSASNDGCVCEEEAYSEFKEIESKIIAQSSLKEGPDPHTTVTKAKVLSLQAQFKVDERVRGRFTTVVKRAYSNIKAFNDRVFKTALEYEAIEGSVYNYSNEVCGGFISLNDL